MHRIRIILVPAVILLIIACTSTDNTNADLNYCVLQAKKTIALIPDDTHMPNNIDYGKTEWHFTRPGSWTCGFWPGILWYIYEYTKDESWKLQAEKFTNPIIPPATGRARSHDVGFMAFCSIGNGYRLTENPVYKQALLQAADSVSVLFNPHVGTFLSWPNMIKKNELAP